MIKILPFVAKSKLERFSLGSNGPFCFLGEGYYDAHSVEGAHAMKSKDVVINIVPSEKKSNIKQIHVIYIPRLEQPNLQCSFQNEKLSL